jgi:radical SAM-linked protein
LRYAKRGRLRFTSHRDVARAFERALRRAGVPMAYSQGFSPHPKVSWVGAAPTGAASEAEYMEIALVRPVDPQLLRQELDLALPDGLDVVEAVAAGPGSLADRIDAGRWLIEIPGVRRRQLADAVAALLAAPSVPVQRMTKSGPRTVDVRAAVAAAVVSGGTGDVPGGAPDPIVGDSRVIAEREGAAPAGTCGIMTAVVRQVTPAVRPEDVLSALRVVAGLQAPVPPKATRIAQGLLDDEGRLADPLALDRGSARSADRPGSADPVRGRTTLVGGQPVG